MPRHVDEIVNEQVERWELLQRRHIETGVPIKAHLITISRRAGTGARLVAEKLAEELNFSLWDRELVDAIATDAHVSARLVEAFDERTQSEIDLLVGAFFGAKSADSFLYPVHLARVLASISKLGNGIILGRGAGLLLPNALNAHIDATDECRIQSMMKYDLLSRQEATDRIHHLDREREQFLINTYGRDRVRNAYFDVSIWMNEFSIEDATEVLKIAAQRRFHLKPPVHAM